MHEDQHQPETAASVLPGLPRVAALDALLREVDGLRLSLETDLSLAASAVEVGAVQVAGDILEADRRELLCFQTRTLGHLAELSRTDELSAVSDTRHARRRRLVPAAPFVAAAAIVGFLTGVVPSHLSGGSADTRSTSAASTSLLNLTKLAAGKDTASVRAQAISLHDQLAPLVAQAHDDPAAAQQALALLTQERMILIAHGDTAGLADVLRESRLLTAQLTAALPPAVRPLASTIARVRPPALAVQPQPYVTPLRSPSAKASASPSSSPKASPSASPKASPTSTASPKPSSSPAGPALPSQPITP